MTQEQQFQELIERYGAVLFTVESKERPRIKSAMTFNGFTSVRPLDTSRKGKRDREILSCIRERITFVGEKQSLTFSLKPNAKREEFWAQAFAILDNNRES